MKTKFTLGKKVRFKLPPSMGGGYGALARLTIPMNTSYYIGSNELPKYRPFPHYLGEGFYHITTIPDERQLIAHEDDLILEEEIIDDND